MCPALRVEETAVPVADTRRVESARSSTEAKCTVVAAEAQDLQHHVQDLKAIKDATVCATNALRHAWSYQPPISTSRLAVLACDLSRARKQWCPH
eukprot:681060-Prymnesium_polylepis.2